MVFISIGMRIPGAEDPPRACPPIMPDGHALIQADGPPSGECGGHVVVECLNHLADLPELVTVGGGLC